MMQTRWDKIVKSKFTTDYSKDCERILVISNSYQNEKYSMAQASQSCKIIIYKNFTIYDRLIESLQRERILVILQ